MFSSRKTALTFLFAGVIGVVAIAVSAAAPNQEKTPLSSDMAHPERPAAQALLGQTASAPVRLNLDAYQDDSGIIATFKGSKVSDPYFGVYPLILAGRAGLDISTNAQRFIAWGLAHQRADGRFSQFCKEGSEWKVCRNPDSDDATLARWVELLYRVADGRALPDAWEKSAQKAEQALMYLRMHSGVYSVFPEGTPGYAGYALFTDNIEVLAAQEALSLLLARRNDAVASTKWAGRAALLRSAIVKQFGAGPVFKRLALPADYTEVKFYPQVVAMPIAFAEGFITQPPQELWTKWLLENKAAWKANAAVDYPWGLLAVASIQAGDLDTAACWLQEYQKYQRTGEHWSVLEESAAQIVAAKTTGVTCTAGF